MIGTPTPLWLLGFIEGDGCFYIGFESGRFYSENGALSDRLYLRVYFSLTQKDKPVLDSIAAYLEYGGVHKHGTKWAFRTGSVKDALKLIGLLDPMPFVSKAKRHDFDVWKTTVHLLKDDKHLDADTYWEIVKQRKTMHQYVDGTFAEEEENYEE
uniref:Orf154 n=1 Tax=Amoebidium parasiticum TaxID=4881 RepID=Q8M0D3_AMOPA|nr:Orf154 [Amoebidium parasiticum]